MGLKRNNPGCLCCEGGCGCHPEAWDWYGEVEIFGGCSYLTGTYNFPTESFVDEGPIFGDCNLFSNTITTEIDGHDVVITLTVFYSDTSGVIGWSFTIDVDGNGGFFLNNAISGITFPCEIPLEEADMVLPSDPIGTTCFGDVGTLTLGALAA